MVQPPLKTKRNVWHIVFARTICRQVDTIVPLGAQVNGFAVTVCTLFTQTLLLYNITHGHNFGNEKTKITVWFSFPP